MQFKKAVGESDVVLNTIDNVIEKTSSQKDTPGYNAVLSNRLGKATKEYSLDAIKLAIPQTNLNKENIKAILYEKGLSGDELDKTTEKLYKLLIAEEKTGKASLGLKNAFKDLISNPMTWITIATAALYAGVRAWTEYQKKLEKATQKFNDAKSALSNAESELSSLESQLSSNNSKIEEYNNLLSEGQSLSLVQQQELDDLQSENELLEAQIELQKSLVDIKANTAAQEAINAANTEKTLYEANVEEYGKVLGFLKTIADYANPDPSMYGNNYSDIKPEAQKYDEKDTSVLGRFNEEYQNYQKIQNDIAKTEQKIIDLKESGKDVDEETKQDYEDLSNQLKTQQENLIKSSSAMSVIGDELKGYIDAVKGTDLEADNKTLVESWEKSLRTIKELGKTGAELAKIRLDNFFSSSNGKAMKSYFDSIIENGGSARKVLTEFGKTGAKLSDIGVNAAEFMGYFSSISEAADDATESLAKYEGTFSSVEKAFESENSGKNWEDMAGYIKSAKDLYDKGLVGTDDFQSVAQFLVPNDIDTSGYEYAADAYVEAFEKAYKTVKKWYDADNPLDSMWAFMDSLSAAEKKTGIDLISDDYKTADDIKLNFETTAEAAKALGVNVSVVENMLDRLKDYGFELDGIEYSGELLSEYKDTLGNIKTLYKDLEDEDSKTRLGKLIDGWDTEYSKYQDDLSQLTEEQVVKIKFEYDLASIQKEIDELQLLVNNGGGTEEYAALLAKKYQKNKLLSDQAGSDFNSESYDETGKFITDYQNKLQSASDEQKQLYQNIISNLMDTQSNILQSYIDLQEYGKGGNVDLTNRPTIPTSKLKDAGYEKAGDGVATVFTHTFSNKEGNVAVNFTPILPDGTVMDKNSFDKYCQEVVDGVHDDNKNLQIGAKFEGDDAVAQAKEAADKIHELQNDLYLGGIQDIELGVTVDDTGTQQEVENLADKLSNGSSITYQAHLDDGSSAEITMWKEEDGTITYTANVDGVEKDLELVKEEDGSVHFKADTTEVDDAKEKMKKPVTSDFLLGNNGSSNITINATDNATGKINSIVDFGNSSEASVNVDATTGQAQGKIRKFLQYVSGINPKINVNANGNNLKTSISNALSSKSWSINVKANVTGMPIGANQASGTAITSHATGTAYNAWTSYRHSIGAYANGTRSNWELPVDENALINEIGQESIVRNGVWQVIPGGAHIEQLKKGDIVFNADQTRELIKYGKVMSGGGHGIVAHADGTAYNTLPAYATGGRLKKPSSSSTQKKKKTKTKTKTKSKSSSSSSSSKTEDLLDWIEIKISRIEDAISNLDTTATSTFASWSNRAKDLSSELSKVTEEIGIQTDAYDRYIEQANSVGLKESIAKLVRNGKIDITKYDDKTKEKISDYQTWYDKAVDCKNAIVELKEKEKELIKQKFDDIATKYDGYISLIENEAKRIEELISQTEAKGLAVSEKYYTQQIADENSKLAKLTAQRNEQVKALADALKSGKVVKDSEAWYEMNQAIDDTTQSIYECNTSVLELNNSIRQLSWDRFDSLQDKISLVADEAEFMVGIMESSKLFDDLGKITDTGMATMGLYAQNYNVYMNQADRYAKEIESINAELSKEENKYNDDLINRKQELIKAQQDAINAANSEKNAIKDLISEGFDAELSSLQDLIDKYGDALDSQQDLYTYQKNVKDQTDNIASLQKQILSYQGDDSEEGRLKLQQAQSKLKDAQTNLKETEMDKSVELQKEMLSDLYD